MKEDILEKIKTLKYPLKVLKDNQAFFIENRGITFIGDEEEVKITN